MAAPDETRLKDLLVEIRDNQRLALERQDEQLAIARAQLERSAGQVRESLDLQRQAVERVRKISLVAVPTLVFLIGCVVYLLVRYF